MHIVIFTWGLLDFSHNPRKKKKQENIAENTKIGKGTQNKYSPFNHLLLQTWMTDFPSLGKSRGYDVLYVVYDGCSSVKVYTLGWGVEGIYQGLLNLLSLWAAYDNLH